MARSPRSGCSARTTLHLVGGQSWTAVPAALLYEPADPYAVRIRFGDAGEADAAAGPAEPGEPGEPREPDEEGVEWLLSRDLLRTGLSGPVGDGDVRIWPARAALDVLFLQLRAPSGEALFELSATVVGEFLRETERLVPLGRESGLLQVDDELSALLQGGPDAPGAP
jgi:hypothetical protein